MEAQGDMPVIVSERWKAEYPGALVGVLEMNGVANPEANPALDARKQALEADLRTRFASLSRSELKSHALIAPYAAYYKRFDKTYHVQHQLESIVFKGRSIPRAAALVEAMFMAELRSMLLTAGHDRDAIQGALGLDVATGAETYTLLNRQEQTLKQGDMFIHDDEGVLSSIMYGPDHRTRITPTTTRVLFTVYAPAGIAERKVREHLDTLSDLVLTVSPAAEIQYADVVEARQEPS
jgi:DNA/RNA-binding domain of Phe-tRNA-synthetase-like protein